MKNLKTLTRSLAGSLTALALAGNLVSCPESNPQYQAEVKPTQTDYFAEVPRDWGENGMALTSGDFDGDGDLDLIVSNYSSKLYFYENDGKGNFTLKPKQEIPQL